MKCNTCGENLNDKWNFCPKCGNHLKNQAKVSLGFPSLFKDLYKQFDDLDVFENMFNDQSQVKTQGISISISSIDGKPQIKVKKYGGKEQQEKIKEFTKKERKGFMNLFKRKKPTKSEEPKSKVRRLADKVIYEIDVPGVKSKKDIAINKLENSIEIKAYAKDLVYIKTIPVDLDIINYYLDNEKLILELSEE